jgi:hypothetical protein
MKKVSFSQLSGNFSHVSEVFLVYNNHVKPADRPKISGSGDANRLFRETWDHTLTGHRRINYLQFIL